MDNDATSSSVADADAMSEVDELSFAIIAAAGQARSLAFEALAAAKTGDFENGDRLLAESAKAAVDAHEQQTALLVREAGGDHLPVDVILVHAQDHLMTAMLAQELITEIIALRKEVAGKDR